MTSVTGSAPRRLSWANRCAGVAALLGIGYAAMSGYWGAGGRALLNTVGGTLAAEGRAHAAGLLVVVWITVVLKLVVSATGLIAVEPPRALTERRRRLVRRAGWVAAAGLVIYGGTLTATGLLVQTGVLAPGAHADRTALRWHAELWDPWFLIWGIFLMAGLRASRQRPAADLARRPCSSR